MMEFLPKKAKPHERAVLILYYILKIKNIPELSGVLGYETPSEVYRILKRYRKVSIQITGLGHQSPMRKVKE